MKLVNSIILASSLFAANGLMANAIDEGLIKQCNATVDPEGNPPDIVNKWCTCMLENQPEGNNTDLVVWSKSGDGAQADKVCEGKSGWKSK